MITAIKNINKDLYKDLFAKASEVLSGYERTQTFDENKTYFYKDSKTNTFTELEFKKTTKEDKIIEFADALTNNGCLYISNGKNPADYNFAPELGITTLEEYYNWLPEIKATILKDQDGNPLKDDKGNVIQKPTIFTKLPLDEPYFEINPNTRAITIPADFKKNGIAVQGDDLAEVVYFMIDRYFDAMDLNNTDIYIEWETPKGKNSAPIKSVSETYLKIIDDENYPGKLIFGWAISDAITKDSGTLKFAVRFIQWNDEKKIVYSFNTLTAQTTIHPNLGLDLEKDNYTVDNCNDRLLERIEPSVVVGGAQAAIPYFLKDIINLDEGYDIGPDHTTGTFDLSVVATSDDTGAVSYVWKRSEIGADAWVEIPGSSKISFVELTREEYEDFQWKLPENRIYYIERSDDTAYLLPKGYYNLNEASTRAWFKTTLGVDIDNEEIPSLFEKRSVLTVEKYGQYRAEARNRIFNSLTKTSSKVATFKTPDSVIIDNKNQTRDKHIIGTDSAILIPEIVEAVGDLNFQWYKTVEQNLMSEKSEIVGGLPVGGKVSYSDETIRILCPTDPNVYTQQNPNTELGGRPDRYYVTMRIFAPSDAVYLRMAEVNSLSNGEDPVVKGDEELITIADKTHGIDAQGRLYLDRWIHIAGLTNNVWKSWSTGKGEGEYVGYRSHFVWYDAQGNAIDNYSIKIQLANEDNFNDLENYQEVEGANLISYIADEPGLYKLKVTRIRNRATTDGTSIEYRVTNAPEVPEFVIGTYDALEIIPVDDLLAGIKTLSVEWKDNVKSDEFYVAWYLYRGDKKMDDLNIVTYKISNAFKSEFNPTDVAHAPVFTAAGEDIEGFYYALVKNKLNGVESAYNESEKPKQDKMFNVTGS